MTSHEENTSSKMTSSKDGMREKKTSKTFRLILLKVGVKKREKEIKCIKDYRKCIVMYDNGIVTDGAV